MPELEGGTLRQWFWVADQLAARLAGWLNAGFDGAARLGGRWLGLLFGCVAAAVAGNWLAWLVG